MEIAEIRDFLARRDFYPILRAIYMEEVSQENKMYARQHMGNHPEKAKQIQKRIKEDVYMTFGDCYGFFKMFGYKKAAHYFSLCLLEKSFTFSPEELIPKTWERLQLKLPEVLEIKRAWVEEPESQKVKNARNRLRGRLLYLEQNSKFRDFVHRESGARNSRKFFDLLYCNTYTDPWDAANQSLKGAYMIWHENTLLERHPSGHYYVQRNVDTVEFPEMFDFYVDLVNAYGE